MILSYKKECLTGEVSLITFPGFFAYFLFRKRKYGPSGKTLILIENYIPLDKIHKLGLNKINPLDVCLIPELLGEKNVNNIKKYLDQDSIKKANIKFLDK